MTYTIKQYRPCFRTYVQARHMNWDRLTFNEEHYNKVLAEYRAEFPADWPVSDS